MTIREGEECGEGGKGKQSESMKGRQGGRKRTEGGGCSCSPSLSTVEVVIRARDSSHAE
jgi:hypothetical protein